MSHAARGFTLIELVVVMIVISVGLLGIARMFGDNISTLTVGEDAQRSAQYAQECTEMILAQRRTAGFSTVSTTLGATPATLCSATSMPTGFTRTIACSTALCATYSGTATSACPNGISCLNVTVTVTKGSASGAMTVMLVNY